MLEGALDAQARRIYQANVASGAPFALFLRNFDREGQKVVSRKSGRRFATVSLNAAWLEARLAYVMEPRIPILGIANQRLLYTTIMNAIPKLLCGNTRWKKQLEELVARAAFIVVAAERLSQGLSFELQTIVQRARQDATVISLPKARAEVSLMLEDTLKTQHGFDGSRAELAQRELLKAAGFQRILDEHEIAFENLDGHPEFADLLESVGNEHPSAEEWVNSLASAIPGTGAMTGT